MTTPQQELMDHIEAIIEDNLGLIDYKEDVIRQLHLAVLIHFPFDD
jgi:hypothetical protein